MKLKQHIVLVIFTILIYGCKEESNIPQVGDIDVSHSVYRTEVSFAKTDSSRALNKVMKLKKDHPTFVDLLVTHIIPLTVKDGEKTMDDYSSFFGSESYRRLCDTIDYLYTDFEKVDDQFDDAFRYFQYYFPQAHIPNVYTFVSEFGQQLFLFRDESRRDCVAVGLDMFMGSEFEYKDIDPKNPSFSDYLTRTFTREHIVPKSMYLIIQDILGSSQGNRLIDMMIHEGKMYYALDKILPHIPDSIWLEYSTDQWKWVNENELEMWSFFLQEDLLYRSESRVIDKYIKPRHNSPKMPDAAPGRTANFMGWKIVEAFMIRNPNVSLSDLLKIFDTQEILDKSRYKPPRKN